MLCSGAAWRDLPERFGLWSTAYQRFRDWHDGTFEQILKQLHVRLNQESLIDLGYLDDRLDSGESNPSLVWRREKGRPKSR